MSRLKPGDRVDCRIKDSTIVHPYKSYDEIKTFEIIATDAQGYYLFVPIYLTIKGSVTADKYRCRHLNIDKKFIDEQMIYVPEGMIYQVSNIMDGMTCCKCGEFYAMAAPNQENGTLVCFSCRSNPYR